MLVRLLALLLTIGASAASAEPVRFAVVTKGVGPDVILIPGLASPATTWDATVVHLGDRYRTHVIEIAGFAGRPAGPNAEGPVSSAVVDELAGWIREQQLQRPSVIGHSLGATLALALAARHPDLVGKLLAVDGVPSGAVDHYPGMARSQFEAAVAAQRDAIAALSPEAFAHSQESIMAGLIKDKDCYSKLMPMVGRSDPKVVAKAIFEADVTDLRPALAGTPVPISVIYAYDPAEGQPPSATDEFFAAAYKGVPVERMVRIDDSFHFVMCDQPQRFYDQVDEFLQR